MKNSVELFEVAKFQSKHLKNKARLPESPDFLNCDFSPRD